MITIVVRGIPAPQGSKTPLGNGRMRESSRAVAPWREAVRHETQHQLDPGKGYVRGVPLAVEVEFRLPRPVSLPKKVRLPVRKKNDIDKLLRAVLDGLAAGGAYVDDGQVTHVTMSKSFASDDYPAGAVICIEEDWPADFVERQ